MKIAAYSIVGIGFRGQIIYSDNGWTNVDIVYWRIYVYLYLDELNRTGNVINSNVNAYLNVSNR